MQSQESTVQTGFITVEGDDIYYEVRGSGVPVLMIAGAGGDSWWYSNVATVLGNCYKVITYDRRGNAKSISRRPQNFELSQQSRDAVAILNAVGEASAHIVGCSSGAIIALDIAIKYPRSARTIIAYEPPLIRIHPRSNRLHRFVSTIYHNAFHYGSAFASLRFALGVGAPITAMLKGAKEQQHQLNTVVETRSQRNVADEFLELGTVTNYNPDLDAIRKNGVKVLPAAGRESLRKKRFYAQTAAILAQKLGCEIVVFPGHHISFYDRAAAWADTLIANLR